VTLGDCAPAVPGVGHSDRRVERHPCRIENLPKEPSRQEAFGESQGEVPGISDEPRAGFEEPLLEARQGPGLNCDGQDQPAQQIAEAIGDHPEKQPHLAGPEAVAGERAGSSGWLPCLP
jgi:hypothetical protein